jgi:hypothetical protein
MDEGRFNMALRKFLKEVGVTSQREVEKLAREHAGQGDALRLRMVLTSPDSPGACRSLCVRGPTLPFVGLEDEMLSRNSAYLYGIPVIGTMQ